MSHFSQIKTKLHNLDALKAALTDLGIDWKEGPVAIRGYQGQTQTAAVAIAQENNFDIGFQWNGSQYELVADLQYWQQPWTVNGFLNRVTQRYALQAVLGATAEQGFQVAEQQECADGTLRLVVQRWSA